MMNNYATDWVSLVVSQVGFGGMGVSSVFMVLELHGCLGGIVWCCGYGVVAGGNQF